MAAGAGLTILRTEIEQRIAFAESDDHGPDHLRVGWRLPQGARGEGPNRRTLGDARWQIPRPSPKRQRPVSLRQ
jgi:hypothetical protein